MFANRFFATASLEGPLFKRVSREERTFHFFADRIKRQNVFEEVGRVVPTAVYERRQSGRLRSSFSKLFSTALASETTATPKVQGSALDPSESFLSGTNAAVLEDMYEKWMTDPSSVDPSWAQFFSNVDREVAPGEAVPFMSRALETAKSGVSLTSSSVTSQEAVLKAASDTVKIMSIIKAYRHRGHLIADLDPLKLDEELGFYKKVIPSGTKRDFEPSSYGFTEADMDREFVVNGELPGKDIRSLRDIIQTLRRSYCGTVGIEYRHILSKVEKDWIAERIEKEFPPFSVEQKRIILRDLADAELFEKFLAIKFPTSKRFGLEGAESLIPGLQALLERGSNLGIENVVIGMPHRGRLNVLANIIGSPVEKILHEFYPHDDPFGETYQGSGDVKYHLGTSNTRKLRNGKSMHFSLVANPSHLEAVDPVVVGKTRAKQYFTGDAERKRTLALLLHGDASFAGQGVVQETLEFSDLRDYTTGGTVHIVVNNQIGFTTDPRHARSSPYPTDVAKTVGMPIFHVNGDDTEAVVRCCQLAMDFRQTFGKDVIVDIFCYRRHGHNEGDQPTFTQPRMYKTIQKHPSILKIYSEKLMKEQVVSKADYQKMVKATNDGLQKAFENSKHWVPKEHDWLSSLWEGFKTEKQLSKIQPTGVEEETLKKIGTAICTVPQGFHLHHQLTRFINQRRESIESGKGIDWSTAEALAIGTLLAE
jgi:2-oxoglutarate dehydrogenase E1 component